jgi:hypothetical protein
MEFLRESSAHERLGFSSTQIAQWLTDAGLELAETKDLAPGDAIGQGKLTVTVWQAIRPGTAGDEGSAVARSRVEA